MKIKDIKNKNTEDLSKLLKEKREELREFRFGTSGSKAKNVKATSALKKDVARILTHVNSLRLSK